MKLTEAQIEERERLRQAEMKVNITEVMKLFSSILLFHLMLERTGKG